MAPSLQLSWAGAPERHTSLRGLHEGGPPGTVQASGAVSGPSRCPRGYPVFRLSLRRCMPFSHSSARRYREKKSHHVLLDLTLHLTLRNYSLLKFWCSFTAHVERVLKYIFLFQLWNVWGWIFFLYFNQSNIWRYIGRGAYLSILPSPLKAEIKTISKHEKANHYFPLLLQFWKKPSHFVGSY